MKRNEGTNAPRVAETVTGGGTEGLLNWPCCISHALFMQQLTTVLHFGHAVSPSSQLRSEEKNTCPVHVPFQLHTIAFTYPA